MTFQDYLPTLIRYLLVAAGIGVAMIGLYFLLRALRVREETAPALP